MSSQGSRLTQIQMRYQQKQMHEIAQKKNDAFDDTQKLLASSLGAGKVRAMFDERRHRITAGIDKSYLLEPIAVETKTSIAKQNRTIAPPSRPTRYEQKMSNYSKVIVPPLQNRSVNHDVNGNNHFSQTDDLLNKTLGGGDSTRIGAKLGTTTTKTVVTRKLTPAVLPTSPPLKNVTNQKASPTRSSKSGNSGTSATNSVRSTSLMSPKSLSTGQTRVAPASVPKARAPALTSNKKENSPQVSFDEDAPVPDGLVRCGICKRNFAEDRIETHQVICQKNATKKRKIYDASKKRVQGTEAETYNRKPISAARAPKQSAAGTAKPNNWRSKHEDFIRTIRAAKEMQTYVKNGGKLSDLPPPPPSENLDYVQCPHCSRRFNEGAASRHIPLCKDIKHNKPKPKPSNAKSNTFAKRS